MNIKNFQALIQGTKINGVDSDTVYFVTPEKTYATNENQGVSLIQTYETSDIFDNVETNFTFSFFNIKKVLDKIKGLLSDDPENIIMDFEFVDSKYNGFKEIRRTSIKRKSPKLQFHLPHPSVSYTLKSATRTPHSSKFNLKGDIIDITDGALFMENLSRIDSADKSGKLNHISFSNENGLGTVIARCGDDYFECGLSELTKPFKVYKRDLESLKARPFSITVGEGAIIIEQGTTRFHLPTSTMNEELEASQMAAIENLCGLTDIDYGY